MNGGRGAGARPAGPSAAGNLAKAARNHGNHDDNGLAKQRAGPDAVNSSHTLGADGLIS